VVRPPADPANTGQEDLPANLVLDRPLALPEAHAAVSTSLAFGGANAALVFSRWEPA
jgi:3-oxoacyl-(acyl-carrier-protein) synthase